MPGSGSGGIVTTLGSSSQASSVSGASSVSRARRESSPTVSSQAVARALRQAVERDPRETGVPSTKGAL